MFIRAQYAKRNIYVKIYIVRSSDSVLLFSAWNSRRDRQATFVFFHAVFSFLSLFFFFVAKRCDDYPRRGSGLLCRRV